MTMRNASPAAVLALIAFGGVNAAAAQTPAEREGVDTCRALRGDQERLQCYDRLFGYPQEDIIAEPPPPDRQSPSSQDELSLLDARWELSPEHKRGTFRITAYKPVYILAAWYASRTNDSPSSPSEGHMVPFPLDLTNTEAKFQISLKSKLLEDVIGDYSDLWFGYTQSSRWQVFNASASRPFRETDYEPELMLNFRTHYSLFGWTGRMAGLSLTHQSNGRSIPLSRSWNRVIASVGVDRPGWTVTFRYWDRLNESRSSDDNPDIEDYIGRGDVLITRNWGDHEISALLRHTLRDGERSRGAVEINWAFPIHGGLKGYAQFFSGYGESLIDYNHRANYFGIGVSLIEWYSRTGGAQ